MNYVKRSSSFRTFPYDYFIFIISTFNRHNSQFVRLVCARSLKGEMAIPLRFQIDKLDARQAF